MSKPKVIFMPHANIQYSQLDPKRRAWVCENCYRPLFELVREVHKLTATDVSRKAVAYGKEKLLGMTDVLGLLMKKEDGLPADVQALVDERAQARKEKNWKRSDELRDQIKAMGYILEDTAAGQKVRKGV